MRAVIPLLRIVSDVDPHQAEAEVAPDDPAEIRLVIGDARRGLVVPNPRSEVRLDADPWRRQWHTQSDRDRKSTRLNSSHSQISYAVFCLKKKKQKAKTQVIILRL